MKTNFKILFGEVPQMMEAAYPESFPQVVPVVRRLAKMLNPLKIYLYNHKSNARGELTSFKLCVVAELADKAESERRLYREIDCEIPFDVILYTPQEWEALIQDPVAFASRVKGNGVVVYG